MFLIHSNWLGVFIARAFTLLVTGCSLAVAASSPCMLQVAVYDPQGNRLPFTVTGVFVRDGNVATRILGRTVDGIAVTSKDDKVYFSSTRIVGKRAIDVALDGPNGKRVNGRFFITGCHQRRSLFLGQSDLGIDVTFVPVVGRITGCRLSGDWWIRSFTMFGGQDGLTAEDGYIDSAGNFAIEIAPVGVRRILVFGWGRQTVRSVAFDVTVGRSVDLGIIDLTGSCPP